MLQRGRDAYVADSDDVPALEAGESKLQRGRDAYVADSGFAIAAAAAAGDASTGPRRVRRG